MPTALAERLHTRAKAGRWGLSVDDFAEALERSAARSVPADRERYFDSLHLEDLALACACAAGHEAAWEHFILRFRPLLYRAASALDPSGGARDLADGLYAELYGVKAEGDTRTPLFHYFHGRSSLATWLRAVLAQRHVDTLRSRKRFEPLADPGDGTTREPSTAATPDVDRAALAARVRDALAAAIARLAPRDRLRLGWYYAQGMTLARIGRVLNEHEATVSRRLARARQALRADVEAELRAAGLDRRAIDECFAAAADDPGDSSLTEWFPEDADRKAAAPPRSKVEESP